MAPSQRGVITSAFRHRLPGFLKRVLAHPRCDIDRKVPDDAESVRKIPGMSTWTIRRDVGLPASCFACLSTANLHRLYVEFLGFAGLCEAYHLASEASVYGLNLRPKALSLATIET